jgi:hypothetical protein
MRTVKLVALLSACAVPTVLGGCAYDYLQRTDRVGYSAGDAVKANLAKQTIDPSKKTMYSTKGLGKNGAIAVEPTVMFEDIEGEKAAAD